MSKKQEIASSLTEIWSKLNTHWTGESANAFHQQYRTKMTEVIEEFEVACYDLGIGATDLSKKLQLIEQSIDNN